MEDPPIPVNSTGAIEFWRSLGFTYRIDEFGVVVTPDPGYISAIMFRFRVWSKIAESSDEGAVGHGCDGGCGGLGGTAGTLYTIGLENTPRISSAAQSGMISKIYQNRLSSDLNSGERFNHIFTT